MPPVHLDVGSQQCLGQNLDRGSRREHFCRGRSEREPAIWKSHGAPLTVAPRCSVETQSYYPKTLPFHKIVVASPVYVIPVKPVLSSTNSAMSAWELRVPCGTVNVGGLISAPASQQARWPQRRLLHLMMPDQLREMSILHPQGAEIGWSRGSWRLYEVQLARFALPSAASGLASPSPVRKRRDATMDSEESGSAARSMSFTMYTRRSLLHES